MKSEGLCLLVVALSHHLRCQVTQFAKGTPCALDAVWYTVAVQYGMLEGVKSKFG